MITHTNFILHTFSMKNPRHHVAVCAFPFGTHAAPLLLLVKRLAAASPDTLFSFINYENSNTALFKLHTVLNIVPCNIMLKSEEMKGNPLERFVGHAPGSFRRRMAEVEAEVGVRISCVISDAFLWFCGEVAEEKGLCWVSVWTANVVSLSAHFHTQLLRTKYGILKQGTDESREQELVDCVPGFSYVHIRDLPSGIITGNIDSPISQMLDKMGMILPKANAVVVNSFEELSPVITNDLKSKMKLLCIGPLSLTSPQVQSDSDKFNCLQWLDKQKVNSVVYISFGTVATPPPHEIVALAEALEGSRYPFLWSIGSSNQGHLPSWFIDRVREDETFGKVVEWAPQMKVLGHCSVGGFVTHCGWNSIIESIVNGVPLICRPMLGDQIVNQRFVEFEINVGVGLEGGVFTKSGMVNALHQVLSSNEGKKMRENAKVFKRLAEDSRREGGSSIENLDTLIEIVTRTQEE